MKVTTWSLLAGMAAAVPAYHSSEYDFVIIGSGPGGGTLAADRVAEHSSMSWLFYVNHYQNETPAQRDSKFAYRLSNGTIWSGLDPPQDAQSLGILYPRGATLGGSSQLNAMNFAIPPDRDWDYIAELTGDEFWRANHMRDLFIDIENCTYAPEGTPGHGSGGFVQVRHRLIIRIFAIGKVRATGMTSLTLPVDQL
ncbi:hypothetical protein ACLX1H_000876 [Fusarium chlamydosporum]